MPRRTTRCSCWMPTARWTARPCTCSMRSLQDRATRGVLQAESSRGGCGRFPDGYAGAVGQTGIRSVFRRVTLAGLAVLLVGTGMLLHRSVLEQYPWSSHSCTEDTEYTLQLARQGLPCVSRRTWSDNVEAPKRPISCASTAAAGLAAIWHSASLRRPAAPAAGCGNATRVMFDLGVTLLVLVVRWSCCIWQPPCCWGRCCRGWGPGTLSAYLRAPACWSCSRLWPYLALGIACWGSSGKHHQAPAACSLGRGPIWQQSRWPPGSITSGPLDAHPDPYSHRSSGPLPPRELCRLNGRSFIKAQSSAKAQRAQRQCPMTAGLAAVDETDPGGDAPRN